MYLLILGLKRGTRDYIVINKQGLYWKCRNDSSNENTNGIWSSTIFANLFLAHIEADRVKVQRKLGTINVRKMNNFFRFIDDLLSLNDDSTFEKHYKDI